MQMSAYSIFTSPVPVAGSGYKSVKPNSNTLFPGKDSIAWSRKTVSNGSKTHCMKTWNPINNKKFETLSYLPPLSYDSIAKEIDYMLKKGWIPCLEFDQVGFMHRENSRMPGYYDGRYWTLWKLPMFACNDSSQVLNEIDDCKKTYPNAYIRCLAFNNVKQEEAKHKGLESDHKFSLTEEKVEEARLCARHCPLWEWLDTYGYQLLRIRP